MLEKLGGSTPDVPQMRDSRLRMIQELEDTITETARLIREKGPAADAEALETLDLLAEVYDVVKNGRKE